MRPVTAILALALLPALPAAASAAEGGDLRIQPQALVGSGGFEPGVALEWRAATDPVIALRPEAFISEDGTLGGGGSLLVPIARALDLPLRHDLLVGPRAVHHNADDQSWEVGGMASWAYDLAPEAPWRHAVGALGTLGTVRDPRHGDNDLGLGLGGFYSYRF